MIDSTEITKSVKAFLLENFTKESFYFIFHHIRHYFHETDCIKLFLKNVGWYFTRLWGKDDSRKKK